MQSHPCKRHVTRDDLSYSPARPVNLPSPIPIPNDPPLVLQYPLQCSLPLHCTACMTKQCDVQHLFHPSGRGAIPSFPYDLPPYCLVPCEDTPLPTRAMRRHAPTYSCHEKTRPYLLVPCEDTSLPTRAMRRHALLLESRVRKPIHKSHLSHT